MKKFAGILVSTVGFFLIAGILGFLGMGVGSFVGEEVMGGKEPMIEMLLGGLIGISVGTAMGGFFARFSYRWITKVVTRLRN